MQARNSLSAARRAWCRALGTLALLGALGAADGAPGAGYSVAPVRFANAVAEPSPLARRLARQRGAAVRAPESVSLRGWVYRPDKPGRHPALVLLHDCRGVRDYQRAWAARLAEWGYVALLVDSFSPRGAGDICRQLVDIEGQDVYGGRVFDAYGALEYLASQPFVDNLRIGVLGWAYDAVLATVIRAGAQQFFQRRFKAAVALYPDCGFTSTGDFVAPVLVLAGAEDDWTPAHVCRRMQGRSVAYQHPVDLRVYPGTAHGFDDPEVGAGVYLPEVRNLYRQPALGASLRYSEGATRTAQRDVQAFLETHIRYSAFRGTLDDLPPLYSTVQLDAATWAVDPARPGPDLPGRGYSTFDLLFTRADGARRRYDIPFPFERLLRSLAQEVRDPGPQRETISVAIIPRGRSLQREVAAPDYYHYPRIVVAVTREPDESGGTRRVLLKDRLFLGYVEKSAVLEVISYNAQLGRFEYQVVRDYRAGGEPQVHYAPRRLCASCHQNLAPIFANAPWAESNANREIARRLGETGREFYGLPVTELGSSVNNIDRSANRANLFAVHDLLWRRLCEADDASVAADCRAMLFRALLQFRLSASNGFARDALFERGFQDLAARNWQRNWPGGLKIPFANIPDRDQLALGGELPAHLDPLTQRAPETIWRWPRSAGQGATPRFGAGFGVGAEAPLETLVATLAERLLASDVRRLDSYLVRESAPGAAARTYRARCAIEHIAQRGAAFDHRLRCTDRAGRQVLQAGLRSASGRRDAGAPRFTAGRLDWLDLGARLQVAGLGLLARSDAADGAQRFDFAPAGALRPRLPNGYRLLRLRLGAAAAGGYLVEIDTRDDFVPLAEALAAMVQAPDAPFAARGALDPVALSARLFAQLGEPYPRQCCEPRAGMPTPQVAAPPRPAPDAVPLVARFRDTCGACHGGATEFPPGFLHGDAERVLANLRGCAERINYRLAMWEEPAGERRKSPMPPIPPLPHDHLSWPQSERLQALRAAARTLLADSGEGALRGLTRRPYDSLATCRPDS